MHKTKNTILIILAVITVGCLLYIPGMKDLGLYRDDWNNFYTAAVRGPAMLQEHYASDRPADGMLLAILFQIFKTDTFAYQIYNLVCRILGSIFFALALLIVWPRTSKMAALAGLLAVAFPGFLQQVDGIAYIPHQTAMLCFMISFWLTALACKPEQKTWNVLFTFLSMLFSFASVMLMEYYVGMEIYRFALIYLMNREQAGNGKPKAFFKCLLSYLPYLIPILGFVAWRIFLFDATRNGANVMDDIVQPFLTHPRHEIADLGVRTVKNIWKLFAGVWTIPAYNHLNGLGMKSFIRSLVPSLVIFAAGQLFLFLMHRRRTDESVSDASNEAAQWLWYGLICGSIAILPMVIAKRDINFSASLDRFAWVGMIGSILFLAGLLGSLKDRSLRNLLTMAAILLAVFVQWQNKTNYINQWNATKDYWQQLMWRAPMLKQGTTIVSHGTLLVEEDYDVFAPASMIYYPDVKDEAGIAAEVMNTNTIRQVRLGKTSEREVRNITVRKDFTQLLAVTKPSENVCLRVIDGDNPIFSAADWTKIPEIGAYSRLDQIITDPETPAEIPFFLGEEAEHGWCYYYEKMELALQKNDAETAAGLADEAAAKGLKAGDSVEWIPVIEAYTESGREDEALEYAENLVWDEIMAYSAADYFRNKENAGAYEAVIELLSAAGSEKEPVNEAEEAAEEAVSAEETEISGAEIPTEEAPADTENEIPDGSLVEEANGALPETVTEEDTPAAEADAVDVAAEDTADEPADDAANGAEIDAADEAGAVDPGEGETKEPAPETEVTAAPEISDEEAEEKTDVL